VTSNHIHLRQRYSLINYGSLADLLGVKSMGELRRSYREWVEETLAREVGGRESRWTESIAVGSQGFVEKTKAELGIKATGREVVGTESVYELRERDGSYKGNFAGENSGLRLENAHFLDLRT
jgi:putative transposase